MSRKDQLTFFAAILLAFALIVVPMEMRLFRLAQFMLFVSVALIGWAVNWAVNRQQKPR